MKTDLIISGELTFSFEEWSKLYKHAKNKKLKFMVSPFSNKALEIL